MKKFFLSLFFLFITIGYGYSQYAGPDAWSTTFSGGGRIYCLAINPTNQNIMYCGGLDNGVYKSTDGGLTWNASNTGMTYFHVQCITISKSNPNIIYAGTDQLGTTNSGVYVSTNEGASWTLKSSGITDSPGIQSIAIHPTDPNTAWCAVFDGLVNSTTGLWMTIDGGNSWFPSSTGMTITSILSVIVNPKNPNILYAGSSYNPSAIVSTHIFKSYDGGYDWVDASNGLPSGSTTTGNPVRCLAMSTDTTVIIAGLFLNDVTGGLYVSTNGGALWTLKHNGLPAVQGTLLRSCAIKPGSNTEFYVGIDRGTSTATEGVWRTIDGGLNWTNFSGGVISSLGIRALAVRTTGNLKLFAGAGGASGGTAIYEYTWTALGVNNTSNVIPKEFALNQNYPNPFNPTTKISFDLPKSSLVNLKLYDLTGREVANIYNGQLTAGSYEFNYNASNLSSGIYFYRLISNEFSATKKMMLVK